MMAANHLGGKPKGLLSLNVDLINQDHSAADNNRSFLLNESAFRQEGISIGQDYLRVEGVTVTRGELLQASLDVQEVIGMGAFSTVRRARWQRKITSSSLDDQQAVEIDVAVKDWSLVDSSHQRRQMLLKELRALCGVTSPTLVQLYGAFLRPYSDTVTIVLEYMDRGSLENFLQQQNNGALSEYITAAILYQMLCGLAALHAPERRMLHRDLKPANVLLNSHGNVKLCDFGTAALLGEESLNMTVLGTTKFMAPERLMAKPYGRPSDVWSLGLVALQCVTGESPFHDVRSIVELLVTIEETTVTDLVRSCRTDSNNMLSVGLQEILVVCLQAEPGKYTIGLTR
jgi:serine/threonine protein kinase